jgi:peptidoglycan LD-endopeptidase LytH
MNRKAGRSTLRRTGFFVAAFLTGAIVGMLLLAQVQNPSRVRDASLVDDAARLPDRERVTPDRVAQAVADRATRLSPPAAPLDPSAAAGAAAAVAPASEAAGIADLRARNMTVPVEGVTLRDLRDNFGEKRDSVRQHEALDILAPRGTRVIAVEDGTIAKLFTSDRGGLTIYQFDPTRTYAYYYAHLDRYAPGLKENMAVERGQLLGFVGTTGNAPKDTPHLHFAIFLLTEKKQWWQGAPLNPFEIWRN